MNTLLIDTHFLDIIIILLKDGKVVDKGEVINKKNNSEYIMPTIIKVIDGIKLDEIIIVNGPGSFTGVRLGVTIAKSLAYLLNIPIKTITTLEVMAISNKSYKVAFSDNNGYYLGEFDSNFNNTKEYKYIDKKAFINNYNEYDTNYNLDAEEIYKFLSKREPTNPHIINPLYIKKIGVEIDKKSDNK